jgi:hypothetical protein
VAIFLTLLGIYLLAIARGVWFTLPKSSGNKITRLTILLICYPMWGIRGGEIEKSFLAKDVPTFLYGMQDLVSSVEEYAEEKVKKSKEDKGDK